MARNAYDGRDIAPMRKVRRLIDQRELWISGEPARGDGRVYIVHPQMNYGAFAVYASEVETAYRLLFEAVGHDPAALEAAEGELIEEMRAFMGGREPTQEDREHAMAAWRMKMEWGVVGLQSVESHATARVA